MKLICSNLDFCYPGTSIPVLRNLNLRIEGPGFHALFGPSGAGKTSLAKLLAGEYRPDAGEIKVQGEPAVLYTHNQERLPGWSAIGRHLERITPEGKAALRQMLVEQFGLGSYLKQGFNQLSLGQQNRVNLLRYLIQDFDVLIMDESLANVDEKTRGVIIATIKKTFPESIFLYISHNLVEVARYCQQIWVLRGVQKSPQAVSVIGQGADRASLDEADLLQQTMLEIVNAS